MNHSQSKFLELRQQLKDSIRKKTQNGNDVDSSLESEPRNRKFPNNNFGSFFGPSQTVIAPRVLQGSKALYEKELSSAKQVVQKTSSSPTTSGSETKNTNEPMKIKAEKLKEARDYSFLFSDDAELPVSLTESAPRDIPIPKSKPSFKPASSGSKMHPRTGSSTNTKARMKEESIVKSKPSSKESQIYQSKPASSGSKMYSRTGSSANTKAYSKEESIAKSQTRKPISKNGPSSSRLITQRPASTRKPDSLDNRRKLVPKQERVEQRKVVSKEPARSQMVPRKPLPSSISNKQQAQQVKNKKRPIRRTEEDDLALQMVREMCGTDRYKNRDYNDFDDRNMEANFEDILKEEKRSARLAKKEDAEQLRLIEEENRQERLRKVKKQKLN